jgi:hypothetical protein
MLTNSISSTTDLSDSDVSTTIHALLIDVPTKIWRPKQLNTWTCPEYGNDIDEELLISKEHGPGLARMQFGKDLPPRDDIILWDDKYQAKLDTGLKIGKNCHA